MNNAKYDYNANRTRDMYKRINNQRGNYKKKKRFLRHENGSLIITDDDIAKMGEILWRLA
jgi:hypothetical protein